MADRTPLPSTWEPEDQLLGALLHLRGPEAPRLRAEIAALVPASAIQGPLARWAYELMSTLIGKGVTPDPTLMLTAARRQPPAADADVPHELATIALRPNVFDDLGMYLIDVYTNSYTTTNIDQYARAVLDDAFRRAAGRWGTRLQNMAEAYADREEITAAITDLMRGELRDLWSRAERTEHLRDGSQP